MFQRWVKNLTRRPGLACALLLLTLPGTPQEIQDPEAKKWDRVFSRVEATQIHGEATFPVSAAERIELDRRLEAYAKDPEAGSSWEAVHTRITAR